MAMVVATGFDSYNDITIREKMMKQKTILIIALLALIILAVTPVQAQTIVMSNPDSTTQQDLIVYYPNSTMYGLYNTTSVIDLGSNVSDYIFTLKPQYSTPLDDPKGFTDGLWAWFRTNLLYVVLLGVIVTIFFKKG
jgi:hypothetical protein